MGRVARLVAVVVVGALRLAACRRKVDRAGPTRIVFPDDSALGRNPDLWIWSLSTIRAS